MFLGFALSVMVAVLITRLFSLHLRHDFGVVRTQAHEPEFLAYAVLCAIAYLAADAAALVLLARVHRKTVPLRPLLLLSLRANFVGGTTSFGGVEIPYQALLPAQAGAQPDRGDLGHPGEGRGPHVGARARRPDRAAPGHRLAHHAPATLVRDRRRRVMAVAWAAGSLWVRRPIGLEQLPERFHKNIHAAREAFGEYHHAGWRVWLGVIAATLVYWVAMFAIIPLILIGLGWHGRPFSIITGQAVLQVIMPLSPLAGGAGVAELGYLALIGPAAAETIRVPSLILWRLCTWLIPVAIGGLAFLIKGGAQTPATPRPPSRLLVAPAVAPATPSAPASTSPPASPRAIQSLEEVGHSD